MTVNHAGTYNENSLGALMGNTAFPRTPERVKWLAMFFEDAISAAESCCWAYVDDYKPPHTSQAEQPDPTFHAVLVPRSDEEEWGLDEDTLEEMRQRNIFHVPENKRKPEANLQKAPIMVNIDTIELGLMRMWELVLGERDKLGYPQGHPQCDMSQLGNILPKTHYWYKLLIQDLTDGDDGDSDAIGMSAVLELALFNQIVYC